uniref:CCHC-type domain-containing protein n=1 Tax=Megaselia scalaris TaxID=36166 RepID=T1GET6_MEGSC
MRFVPGFKGDDRRLDRIYANCRSEFKIYAKRHEFTTLREFTALAETLEGLSESTIRPVQNNQRNNHQRGFTQNHYNNRRNDHQERTAAVITVNKLRNPSEESNKELNSAKENFTYRPNPFRNPQANLTNDASAQNRQSYTKKSELPRPQYQCYNCDRFGHTARFCQDPIRPWCRYCRKRDVTTESCECRSEQRPLEWCPRCKRQVVDAQNCECRVRNQQVMASRNDSAIKRIDKRPHISITLFGKSYRALLDTGSTASYISEDVALWANENGAIREHTVSSVKLADGSIKETSDLFRLEIEILASVLGMIF